jgi:hypothetical protein
MAPHKCNYLVFTNSNLNVSDELKIKLNGIELKYDNNPTFLGIRFDNHLTFKNQIDYYDYIDRHYMLIMCSFLFTRK